MILLGIDISVVVPVYNRPELLEKAINALEGQSVGRQRFEAILVYGKNPEVKKVCEKAAKKFSNFIAIESDSESPARKRNIGISAAKGKIIAFTDDDCIPEKDWLSAIAKNLGPDNGLAGIEGLTYTEGKRQLYSNAPVNLGGGLFPTCNMAFRKKVLDRIGGFDEAYHFYREDTDLAFRAMDFGKIEFCKEAKVLHPRRKVPLLRPLETIFLLKEDVRLMKKQWKKYWEYLGKQFLIEIVKLIASGVLLLLAVKAYDIFMLIASLYFPYISKFLAEIFSIIFIVVAFIIAWFSFLWFGMKSKFTIVEFFTYPITTIIRSIFFLFFLVYYWVTVK